MKVYVAGALADVERVRRVQAAVVGVGHELTLDWTLGPDASLVDFALAPEVAGRLASDDLDAVLAADAVLVVLSEHEGRGMYVELGAALARAVAGDLEHLVVVGAVRHGSVFFYHPAVTRVDDVDEWLSSLPEGAGGRTGSPSGRLSQAP